MELSSSSIPELLVPPQQIAAVNSTSKRRKMIQKTVITVKVEENSSKQRGDGPPSDTWSWRKYGQKPIKGSPYPRNYYRCSTAKGCSAKKQVEKCRNDSSTLIITYTSSHNHPGVSESLHVLPGPIDLFQGNSSPKSNTATIYELENCNNTEAQPPSISPTIGCSETTITQTGEKKTLDFPRSIISNDEEGPLPYPLTTSKTSTRLSSIEDDFFDELEELPISPSFASLLRSSFFDERILLPTQ